VYSISAHIHSHFFKYIIIEIVLLYFTAIRQYFTKEVYLYCLCLIYVYIYLYLYFVFTEPHIYAHLINLRFGI